MYLECKIVLNKPEPEPSWSRCCHMQMACPSYTNNELILEHNILESQASFTHIKYPDIV